MKPRIELTLALLSYEAALLKLSMEESKAKRETVRRRTRAKREILQELIDCVDTQL